MRRPARPRRSSSPVICLKGQIWRLALCTLLALGLAFPVRAAPVLSEPTESGVIAGEAPVASPASELPPSEQQAEARRLFRLAKEQFNAAEYAAAAGNFEASFAAAESPEAAYNAALAHDKAGARLATMTWFRRYLAYESSTRDTGYPHALRRVEELRARLGELRLQVDSREPVLAVLVNGERVAMTDFPQLVEPGRIEVRLLGDRPDAVADIPVEVAPGGTWTIHFTGFARTPVEPAPRPDPPVVRPEPVRVPDPDAVRRQRALGALTWTGAGLTAASAITMGVLGGLALRQEASWESHLCGRHVCADQYVAAESDADALKGYVRATNVLIGVTAGLAVITLALGVAALRERQKARDAASGRLRVTFAGLQLAF